LLKSTTFLYFLLASNELDPIPDFRTLERYKNTFRSKARLLAIIYQRPRSLKIVLKILHEMFELLTIYLIMCNMFVKIGHNRNAHNPLQSLGIRSPR